VSAVLPTLHLTAALPARLAPVSVDLDQEDPMPTDDVLVAPASAAASRVDTKAPGPRYLTPFGAMAAFRRDKIGYYLDAAKYGDVVRVQMGPAFFHAVFHPNHIQHVLQGNHKNYVRSGMVRTLVPAMGESLFTTDGATWLRQRRLMQPAFHRQRIVAFGTLMTETAVQEVERVHDVAKDGRPLNIMSEMMHLTMAVTAKALFSNPDIMDHATEIERAMLSLYDHFDHRFSHPFTLPESVPTPRNRRFWRSVQTMDRLVYRIIAERRASPGQGGDFLAMLLDARDEETGEGLTDKELRDHVWMFMVGGVETTAVMLAHFWYVLSMYPEVERRFRAEVAAVLGGRLPTVEDMPRLAYTRMVISEVLRLYPSTWANSRDVVDDDEIGGYRIPGRSLVVFSPYVTHRDPRFWENPEGFDPERFTPERIAARPRYAYFPFAGGPRLCIGQEFAVMEATLVLTTIAQHCRFHLVPGYRWEPYLLHTLRPRGGISMTLSPS
jgi:cytochrome P450